MPNGDGGNQNKGVIAVHPPKPTHAFGLPTALGSVSTPVQCNRRRILRFSRKYTKRRFGGGHLSIDKTDKRGELLMTRMLLHFFVKDNHNTSNPLVRGQYGKLAGWVGIFCNLLLFAAKLFVGIQTGSISITADAMNNLSDSAASMITLAAFKLSQRPADDDHPYGHARYEYISGVIVSCLIIVVGLQFLVSSFEKILSPSMIRYAAPFWVILAVSMLVKLWLGHFHTTIGKVIASSSLSAAAADSRNDVIITGAVLASAVLSHFTGLMVDGYMGVLVAAFILYSGIGLIKQTLSPLLGEAPDKALVDEIQKKILSYESVIGLHDLMVHDYGPGRRFASVHVEFSAKQDIMVSHDIIDHMERDFAADMQISLIVHLDPVITDDPLLNELKTKLETIARSISPELTIHDFRMVKGIGHSNLIFDVVVPTHYQTDNAALRKQIANEVHKINENYFCVITIDQSYIKYVQPENS